MAKKDNLNRKICFKRENSEKRFYIKHNENGYEVFLCPYSKELMNKSYMYLMEHCGACFIGAEAFEGYYTVYEQISLFDEVSL
jgi:hypothetical protein